MTTGRRQLRLLSYNIQAGTTTANYREYLTKSWRQVLPNNQRIANLDSIAELVADYDIVALQEVDCGSLRSGFLNQAKYLATHAGFPHWHHQGNRKVGVLAHAGNGLLSRIPPSEVEEHKLPGAIPGRGAMVARFGEGPAALWLVVLHLALGRRARSQQLDYVAGLIRDYPHVVVMGDLNTGPGSRELSQFCDRAGLIIPDRDIRTFPSWEPKRAIDHILVSPDMDIADLQALPVTFSDHRPLAMSLNLDLKIPLPDQTHP
ncbi:endonuclease/exonuclease/phosphatase family protein [Wenzhouxiangella marina]|uniref:Endonuclease/exonuclease/phosphatase n=1 Tax=Wenzhouxiangella marina TaxID=1579979 RepID=A0A0K0XZ01_9GAMM|nr:endonuclease/exonuclease/phosphatase family protein [Wenzhouxiangella marina]AKS42918.1 Endonuclease/exonuclease/phosphatase [Wenzhouxiangella marina]MBB6087399.1 endonuclease/exonuclease/phosphatase family metal-dependent hydrolase [Wenzhouxiangella marina]